MTTTATSRRAFLTGSAVAVGGLLMAGRLVGAAAGRDGQGKGREASKETVAPYLLDLPRPPLDTRLTGFDPDAKAEGSAQ